MSRFEIIKARLNGCKETSEPPLNIAWAIEDNAESQNIKDILWLVAQLDKAIEMANYYKDSMLGTSDDGQHARQFLDHIKGNEQ